MITYKADVYTGDEWYAGVESDSPHHVYDEATHYYNMAIGDDQGFVTIEYSKVESLSEEEMLALLG